MRVMPGWMWHSNYGANDRDYLINFTATYGLHTIEDRKELWSAIENLNSNVQNSQLIMGDFNSILKGKDRSTLVMDAEIRDFEDMMNN
ncbi:hypothetical protein MTR67_018401 [Solanum verrucosum]|uniref:Endonuclease/exonuclease/phosphatase domain-containing protein n=1 Tax=Solanum verrucosum TaxID=315347 RepID=A0AAF0QQQ4_SOLVR|nr:hypothetical protein MTR67_018401 [Solanum verrucosum]